MDMKPETVARLARERKAEAKRSWSEMIARLRDKYDAEPNREYAELMPTNQRMSVHGTKNTSQDSSRVVA